MSNALPRRWTSSPLGEIAEINPRHPKHLPDSLRVSFAPMPSLSVDRPEFEVLQERLLGEVRKGFTHFANGDVLFAKITPCMENGKAAVAAGLHNGFGCGTTELHVIRPRGKILPLYVYYFVHQPVVRRLAEADFTGSAGQARVPARFIEALEIPVPPLAEQRRIVAKLEEMLGKVDACRKRLAKIPMLVKRFRQSVLAAACSGRLTADWREGNEGQYVTGDLADAPNGFQALPETWRWAPLEAVCEKITDCPHSTPEWTDSGRLCVRTTNFKPGVLELTEVRYVSDATFKLRIERLSPQPGDILYSREGGILGIACMIPQGVELCLGQRMMLFRTNSECTSTFLMNWLNSPSILQRVQDLTGGSASPHLNVRDIKGFPTPLPPLPEQREIVRRVEALFALVDQIEARSAMAKAHIDRLTQSILAKAFRGELVPQDPNDEPASVLLERIRAERSLNSPRAQRGGSAPRNDGRAKRERRTPRVSGARQ